MSSELPLKTCKSCVTGVPLADLKGELVHHQVEVDRVFPSDGSKISINVVQASSGGCKDVLFMHGYCLAWVLYKNQLANKKLKKYNLYAMDYRGMGQSTIDDPFPLDAVYNNNTLADDISEVIRQLNLKKPVIVFHSISGTFVADFLRKYGDRGQGGVGGDGVEPVADKKLKLGGLVDLASLPVLDGAFLNPDFTELLLNGDLFTSDFEFLLPTTNAAGDQLTYCKLKEEDRLELAQILISNNPGTRLGSLAVPAPEDLNIPVWESVTVPVLLIAGKNDAVLTPEAFLVWQELFPEAKAIDYCNCGHLPSWEVPKKFAHDLNKFLKKVHCGHKHKRCHSKSSEEEPQMATLAQAEVKPKISFSNAWKDRK